MPDRPNPDELLAKVEREQAKAKRGRLKIFFGASVGVGKTYAMLLFCGLKHHKAKYDMYPCWWEPLPANHLG